MRAKLTHGEESGGGVSARGASPVAGNEEEDTVSSSRATKPLGRKTYGSIGHLPGSRLGPGDHAVHPGQARIVTEKARDRHDVITVTEKLDGSCTAVANVDGQIMALGRAGWPASSSPYEQHQLFAAWVRERGFNLLRPGERLVGEWLAQAHGTRYDLTNRQPWVVFDLFTDATTRAVWRDTTERTLAMGLALVPFLTFGPASIKDTIKSLGDEGFYGALDSPEGVVWRAERRGAFDFLAKYVRPDKVDGSYLPELSNTEPIWNWKPLADTAGEA